VGEQQEASGGGGGGWFGGGDDDYSIAQMPAFELGSEGLADRVSERTVDLLLLAVFAVLFFLAAFLSFVRSDVT